MWASATQEETSTLVPVPSGRWGPCLVVSRSEQRGVHQIGILGWECHLPATLHPRSPAPYVPQQAPRPGLMGIPCFSVRPHSTPSTHTHRNIFITKSFFIEGWVRDRNRGCTGSAYPYRQRGQMLAHTLPPLGHHRVRPGLLAVAVALDARLEWS